MSTLTLKDEFELREKRLKLVYKILYVLVALWISLFVSLTSAGAEKAMVAMYSFFFSIFTLYIVNITKYVLKELSCLKISNGPSERERVYADVAFSNIWRNFSIIGVTAAGVLLAAMYIPEESLLSVMTFMFFAGTVYFGILLLLESPPRILKKFKIKEDVLKTMEAAGILVSVIVTYSLFSMFCWTAVQI